MTQQKKKGLSKCPSCGEKFYIGDRAWIGQFITCQNCEDELEIIRLDPVILDWAYLQHEGNHFFEEELEMGYNSRFTRYGRH